MVSNEDVWYVIYICRLIMKDACTPCVFTLWFIELFYRLYITLYLYSFRSSSSLVFGVRLDLNERLMEQDNRSFFLS